MKDPQNLAELEDLLRKMFTNARVTVDSCTWEVFIGTGKYLANGDATNTLHDEWKDTYKVSARDEWDANLQKEFGERESLHQFSPREVVRLMERFGRAEIRRTDEGIKVLEFHNGYD